MTTKSLGASAILLGCGVTAASVFQAGCSSTAGDGPRSSVSVNATEGTGTLGLHLALPGGQALDSVDWTIAGPNSYSQSGTVSLENSLEASFQVGGIPAGAGYTVTISAAATDGTICSGEATFSVVAGATTTVIDDLQCSAPAPETGAVNVNAPTYQCASAFTGSISVSPSETTVGASVALTATSNAPNPGAATFVWSAPSGSFSAPASASTSFTCTVSGPVTLTLTVGDGPVPDGAPACPSTTTTASVQCDAAIDSGIADATVSDAGGGADAGTAPPQALFTSVDPGTTASVSYINLGTAIGEGDQNGGTPPMLTDLAADPNNTQTIASNDGGAPFFGTGTVPDPAAVLCRYDGGSPPVRISHVTGAKFETSPDAATSDPIVALSPAYFPLAYSTTNTPTGNAFGGKPPIIGLFDWRPKDLDESVLVAESDDQGKTWFFMQNVLELNTDYTNPIMGGSNQWPDAGNGCPPAVGDTNANTSYPHDDDTQDDDGWGHASVLQLPGVGNAKTGQFLYLLDRNTNDIPGTTTEIVDGNPLWVISLAPGSSVGGGSTNKFPLWNTNFTGAGNNDFKSIASVLNQTPDAASPITVTQTVGLTDPDGIMAVFPTSPTADAGSPITVLWVQKILDGDDTGSTALPTSEQCTKAPFSGKVNHDIATVRLATTTDGVHFTDLGPTSGLSDPTTVDYNENRWVSPRGTLIDIFGDQTRWGLYFAAGNCLDGDSDAFHYIGYAESADMVNWTIYNGINNPIASINPITTTNQATGTTVTIPATPPVIPTMPWFAERLYAPTATQIDATHLSMTFAGYGVQTPNNDLLDYRQIGNVVLDIRIPSLPPAADGGVQGLNPGVPNNINAH